MCTVGHIFYAFLEWLEYDWKLELFYFLLDSSSHVNTPKLVTSSLPPSKIDIPGSSHILPPVVYISSAPCKVMGCNIAKRYFSLTPP